jgi:ApbE superfamily uncharacterized protein (UPF0280 family)
MELSEIRPYQQQTFYRVLEPGKVHFDYGPVSMVVIASAGGQPLTELCCEAFKVIDAALREISAALPVLRRYPADIGGSALSGIPLKMLESVIAVGEPTLTPMAAVAGAVADSVADWLFARDADRVLVNNGGDIALRLGPEESACVGIISSLISGEINKVVEITANDGIGGIATSGLGGRSFTRGVSEGVTAFAKSAVLADALATHLANASYIPSPRVFTEKAGILDPASDIKDLEVVIGKDTLTNEEVKRSLEQVREEALRQMQMGNLLSLQVSVESMLFSLNIPENHTQNL